MTRAAVSYVLSGRAEQMRLSKDLVRRVRQAAEDLGYVPNHAATSLASGRSQTLGLLLGDAAGRVAPFWSPIAEGVEAGALEAGYDVLLIRARGDAALEGLRRLQQRRVDGLVVLGRSADRAAVWREAPVPPVVIRTGRSAALPGVELDARPGIDAAVEHLAGLGHRRLLWLGPARGVESRARAVDEAARRQGLATDVIVVERPGDEAWQSAESEIAQWGDALRGVLPDRLPMGAILCWNDRLALGLYAVLAQRGLRVPSDVSVVGFDDQEASLGLPGLASISHEFRRMGIEATRLALRIITGELSADQAPGAVVRVPSRYVVRPSVGPSP